MPAPLVEITITSIYRNADGDRVPLPRRMALCSPDMKAAVRAVAAELEQRRGRLLLSDLFRSFDMQLQSHLDFVNGKKKAFSPPPGGSLHEAGRALDLDLDSLTPVTLAEFWDLAGPHGLLPIINKPTPGVSESWHFDCRGSHHIVYEYYRAEKGTNFKPYAAMAASAILAIGVQVEKFGQNQTAALIQSALVRLGHVIGNIDGSIGTKTRGAIEAAGVPFGEPKAMLVALEGLLRQKFPREYEVEEDISLPDTPAHVIQ
jgi:zinc D-Ala-D-Ala carboxypeptidase